MRALELIADVDAERRLSAVLPPDAPEGPVRVIVLVPDGEGEDAAGSCWQEAVAREWAADWADEREDIYSLSDGEPVDAAR